MENMSNSTNQVSKLTLEENYAAGSEALDTLIEITSAFIVVGQFAFPEVEAALGAVVAVGGVVKALTSVISPDDDPVIKKLGELETKIDTLADKMNAKFADLKAFMTEIKFDEDISQPTFKLMDYLKDCLEHPAAKGVENFLESYKTHKPLDLLKTIMGEMEKDTTNPLKMAMSADILKTSTTFEKWQKLISGVLGQFLFLEAYANGLQDSKDTYDSDRMREKSKALLGKIDQWKQDYIKENAYWSGLKTYIGQFQDDTSSLSNTDRADKLKDLLDTCLTTDALYLTISVTSPRVNDFGIHNVVEDQLIESYERGNCNIFIYRSLKANISMTEENYQQTHDDVKACMEGRLVARHGFLDYPKELFDNPIRNCGMIAMIMIQRDPETRSCNCPGHQWGPGWWETCKIGETRFDGPYDFRVIAGLL
ncbi:hypothetical protein GCK72_021708 [Caenorhabditis remanei]|uniref:Uncharacterized protein n=1 Tax=Caenorhabditis remanei TaxID=31234 RepID=A0A6A5GLI3_CAERE|nr:hypothetical protein GCK72_021708 [Caenorhabditis remanei]KAF1755139.1 hypothetical protein GCK72_021708 [Caenorhabditis remanei]